MKKTIGEISIVYILVLLCALGASLFNRIVLMTLPLPARMLCMPLSCWLIQLAPLIAVLRSHMEPEKLGLEKSCISRQLLIGILCALVMSVVLTLLPRLFGFGDLVDSGSRRTRPYQYIYNLFYYILGVGASEEFAFRGYFYERFRSVFRTERAAVIISSVLFGLLHVFSGNIVQVFMTMLLGVLFCLFRLKVKHCSLLSLMIAHGVYDWLISVLSSVLLN